MKAILALDQGTTASKAALFGLSGRMLGMGRAPVATRFGSGGRAEQDPDAILTSQSSAIRRALAAAGSRRLDLVAAGIASQRSTFVLWERATGRPVAPAPTWQDTSAAAICARMSRHAGRVRRLTGLPLSPHYSAPKLRRLLDARPGLRRRAERGEILFGSVATFLLWHLSGGRVHATDPTQAARTLLFGLSSMRWEPALLDLFGVPRALLPEVRDSLDDFGVIGLPGARGGHDQHDRIPVRAMLGDQQAALMGLTSSGEGAAGRAALINYGTGAFVLVPAGSRPRRREGLLTSVAWSRNGRALYLAEGTVNAAGATLDWLRREMRAPASLEGIETLCRRAPGGTLLLPSFWGLGSMHASERARWPVLAAGLTQRGTAAALTRAGVDAIAHLVHEALVRAGVTSIAPMKGASSSAARWSGDVRRVVASGSLSRLRYLVELQAALLGRSVEVAVQKEATLAGAARAAARGAGLAFEMEIPCERVGATPSQRQAARARHREWRRLLSIAREWGTVEAS